MAKDVVKKSPGLPAALMKQMAADAGKGSEGVGADDMVVPFVKLAQSMNPELKKAKPEYISGLEEGMFFNSASNEVYGEDFAFVPVKYERQYLEFQYPREGDGGFKGSHDGSIMNDVVEGPAGENLLPDAGSEIIITGHWYVLVLPDGGRPTPAVISLAKTQFKASRKLMYNLKAVELEAASGQAFTPPLWYNVVRAHSAPTSNEHGDWMLWNFVVSGNVMEIDPDGHLYNRGKEFFEAVKTGKARAAEYDREPGEEKTDIDDEVPF